MSSTFGGIQQAASSLAASQYGLQIVEQNISNASTTGYTRQAADQAAIDTVGGVPRRYVTGGGPGGVEITGTSRLNDPVIDARARTENARSAQTDAAAAQLSQIEDVFPEPSDTGLGGQLSTFWKDWANVANTPSSGAARKVLLQDANTVANTLQAMSQSLSDVKDSTVNSLNSDVDKVNQAASSLNDLNKQIALGTATGSNVNSLLDQRDTLLDQLSSLVGGVATINADGTANVTVGVTDSVTGNTAQTLVDGTTDSYNQLTVDQSNYAVSVVTSDDPPAPVGDVTLGGGSAQASVVTLTDTLPDVQTQLDTVASTLASQVNGVQSDGYDQNGAAGTDMFGGGPPVKASNITVTLTDGAKVAASATAPTTDPVTGDLIANDDGSNALTASGTGAAVGSPDDLYNTLVGDVGSKSSLAQQQQSTQDAVTSSVNALRQSASGVNLDEEVTKMLTLQRSYQASSKVLATMNSMLDTLINGLGIGS